MNTSKMTGKEDSFNLFVQFFDFEFIDLIGTWWVAD